MDSEKIIPIILSGGSGTRLWPLSRKNFPKQFLGFEKDSEKTLLQNTCERILSLENLDKPIIVCNEEHRFIVAEQIRRINLIPKSIILEPFGRGTCPAIAISTLKALQDESDPYLLVMTSDHIIKNKKNFIDSIRIGKNYAKKGRLVTFGIKPTSPETGYGYIESSENLNQSLKASNISKFIEKPNIQKANQLIKNKNIFWNSGIFLFKAKYFISELKRLEPKLLDFCIDSLKESKMDLDFERIEKNIFASCPNISIDNAVMEKTSLGTVISLDAAWRDLGSWDQIWENHEKDINGNFQEGKVFLKNCKDNYFKSETRLVVGVNVKNLIVVETIDAVLVLEKNASQKVKEVVQELKDKSFKESSQHTKSYRPWGNYINLMEELNWKVKKLVINPNQSLSLQMHKHRSEHWIVVDGIAKVEIDNEVSIIKENESAYIPNRTKHRLTNPGDKPLIIIEVQSGDYLEEDDIIRYVDDYGRFTN